MDSNLMMWMILGSLMVSGGAIAIASWFPRGKPLAHRLMVAGATMMPVGLIAMTLYFEVLSFRYHEEWVDHVLMGAMCGGALVFAMGYVLDRISRRNEQDFRAAEQEFLPQHHRG
jgi:hypothetical protein